MALNSTLYPNISRVVSGAVVLFENDSIILCNTSAAPVTMTLLTIPAGFWQTTWKLYITDISNNAGTNNITINAPSGYTINGLTSLIIKTNGGGATITIGSDTAFFGSYYPILTIADAGGIIAPSTTKITFSNATVVATSPTEVTITTSGGGGGVSSVGATLPLSSTGGTSPVISMPAADTITDGYITASDWNKFNNKTPIYLGAVLKVAQANELTFNTGYFNVTNPFVNTGRIGMLDSGWVDLDGFAWIEAAYRPKCRRLGSAIYFKGNAIVPMEDPSNPANLYQPYGVATEFYEKVENSTSYIGADAGAVVIDPAGGIQFNKGNSVLPTSVFNIFAGDTIDSSYYTGWKPFNRRFYCDTVVPISTYAQEVSVTAVLNAYIDVNGNLRVATIYDIENGLGLSGLIGSSTYRMLTPRIVQGDVVPNYIARDAITGENAQVGSVNRYQGGYDDGDPLTANEIIFSGANLNVLTVTSVPTGQYIQAGQTILTAGFAAGTIIRYQLTGVGGGAGTYFISDPNLYVGASSVLLLSPRKNAPMQTGVTPYNQAYAPIGEIPYKYPFDMDGSVPAQLGGMVIDLSGLVVFLDPKTI